MNDQSERDTKALQQQLTEIQKSLADIQQKQHLTNQALFGDETIGLNGVIQDLKSLKHWRNEVAIKTSYMAGGVAVVVTLGTLLGKYIVSHIL